jgi:hypothetical protein
MSTVRLPDALRVPVTDAASGRAWVRALVAAGLEFHLDDDPATIVRKVDGRYERLFNPADAVLIETTVARLYELPTGTWGSSGCCPNSYLIDNLADEV